jgi:hypothetical protein
VPNRFKNPIEVPTVVFDGLETVQDSREASMMDHHRRCKRSQTAWATLRPPCGFGITSMNTWRVSFAVSWSPSRNSCE